MFNKIIEKLNGLNGIEFGGPTELFYNPCFNMDLYKYVNLDSGNLLDHTSFSNLPGHNNKTDIYEYGSKQGKQFNIDCANINDIMKLSKYDFIVTSHVVEHIANPIKAIKNWKNILKNDGYILSIIPDYRCCFDRQRPRTMIEHLINDYNNDVQEDDKTHIEEQKKLHDWSMGGHPRFYELCDNNFETRVIHHHTFDIDLVNEMFSYCGYTNIICYKHDDLNIINLCKINHE